MKHRGRIQAQGENLESSESWAQNEPLTKNEGLKLLENLKSKIPKKEAEIRENAFNKASEFIQQGPHEVIIGSIFRSYKVKGTKHERVDIEIQSGIAFINS
jgi:hypothetical protein